MDLRKIKKLIELVEESGVTELEVSSGDESIRISMVTADPASRRRRPQCPLLNSKKQHRHRQRKLSRHQWPVFSIKRPAQRPTRL